MPIKHVAGGYRWGEHGHVYATREGAEKQAEAAYAHGYAGDAATQGAGLLMCTPQGKALFLRRSDSAQDCAGMWDLPGGTADAGETPLDTARREAVEEIGDVPEGQTELLTDILADEVRFVTFLHMIKQEFAPDLNDEHSDHVWADLDNPPEPLHPGVRRTLAAMQAPKMAGDAEFKEGDHPRAENGQFGSGGSPTQSNQYDHEKIAKSLKLSGWNKGNIQEGKRQLYLGSTAAKQLALMAGYKMTRESDGRDVINASNNEFEIIGKQWLEKKEESRKNKAAFKEKQKQIAASKEKTKMAGDAEHWITAHPNSSGPGTPILIEGTEGGGYSIKGGAGGKLDGKSVQPKSMSVARLNEKTSQFGNPDFKPYEPPSKSTKEPASQKPLQRTYLRVPYAEKEFAKKHGAKWDAEKRSWFIPENKTLPVELQKYEQVTPEKKGQVTPEKKGTGTPVFVSDRSEAELNHKASLLGLKAGAVIRGDEYGQPSLSGNTYNFRDEIKKAGGRFDPESKTWAFESDEALKNAVDLLLKSQQSKSQARGAQKSNQSGAPQSMEKLIAQHPTSRGRELPKHGKVSEEDPSIYGSWLLGHEGESWSTVRQYAPNAQNDRQPSEPNEKSWAYSQGAVNRALMGEDAMSEDEGDPDDMTPEDDLIAGIAMDRGESGQPRGERIAFDKKSVRSFDQDGRMRVAVTPISKANVCPYLGREIPGCEELGLDHDKQYRLYRDPEELAKAAPTFNNLPILSRHVPVTAEKPMKDLVIGATGTDAAFDAPYLTNALMFWDAEAIQAIESDKQRELSCAYHYVPDMTPGVFEGQPYDGVMRAIRGNHVALVIEGRAGPDVIVADHLPLEIDRMTTAQNVLSRKAVLAKGALSVGLPPLMARSRQLTREALGLALDEALKSVASDNWRKAKPAVVAKLKPLLASDSNVAKLTELLDNLDSGKREGDDEAEMVDGEKQVKVDTDPTLAKQQGEGEDDEPTMMKPEGMDDDEIDGPNPEGAPKGENAVGDPVKEILDLIGHEHPNYQAVSDKLGALQAAGEPAPKDRPAGDEPPSSPAQPKAPTGAVMKGQTEVKQGETATATEKPVTKAAMDAAIRQAQAQVRATHEALEFVAPWVGKLSAIAFDSAEQVYAKALELRGRPTKDIHPSAYKAILEVLPKPGAAIEQTPRLGQDAVKTPDNFASLFPDAGRVRRV